MLSTKLDRVEKRARADRASQFNNLRHLLDLNLLSECFRALDGKKAQGVDGISKERYGKNLEINLSDLILRIRRGSYHPKPSRIVEIPKPDGSKRPLAISCFEDKLVQEGVRRIIERIFEPLFLECSYGFRPKRNAHMAIAKLGLHLEDHERCYALVDIDLRKYFNTIPHAPLVQILRTKIKDERFLRLVIKLLKAPTLDGQGVSTPNAVGSPQGSILSPLLSNIYLHYVLDLWFVRTNQTSFRGRARMVRYADDVVFTFGSMDEAKLASRMIETRLRECGLAINEAKTRIIESGARPAERYSKCGQKLPTFTFLGFTHAWGKAYNRRTGLMFWRVKRSTDAKRFRSKLREVITYIKDQRHNKQLLFSVKRIIQGYLNYAAITDNTKRIAQFNRAIVVALYKWLNRRSQKRSFTWLSFNQLLKRLKFPQPRITTDIHALSRTLQNVRKQ